MEVSSGFPSDRFKNAARFEVIAIGASAGGLEPIMSILRVLPAAFSVPIIVVLHVPERRESALVDVLTHSSKLPVRQADDKAPILPGHIHVAGPGYHLSVEKNRHFSLSDELPQQFSRPSIDVLFQSLGEAYGRAALALLLSGASEDGAKGLASVKENKGTTVIQDPNEARFPLMPQAALKLRRPDWTLTVEEIQRFVCALGESAGE